jgi:hypothetical protein
LSVLLFLFASASQASIKPSCDRFLGRAAHASSTKQNVDVQIEEGVTLKQVEERLTLLKSINQMVGKDLKLPETIHFTLLKQDENAHCAQL